jgi:ankyrin repeat protein
MTRQELAKALKDAAKAGDVGAIRAALAAGADLNDPGQPGEKSALYLAAEGGHLLAVQYLCQCGADPDYVSAFGKMPVLAAVKKRSLPVVQYLLPYSAESLRITILGGMGLIECALSRTPEAATIARTLLAAGIHPDSDSAPMTGSGIMEGCCLGETAPLFYACFRHNALVAAALLEGGADPNYEGIAGGPSNPLEAVFLAKQSCLENWQQRLPSPVPSPVPSRTRRRNAPPSGRSSHGASDRVGFASEVLRDR